MTVAAAWQTWKQITLLDFRQPPPSETASSSVTAAPTLNWTLLRDLDVTSGSATAALAAHHGRRVRIPGFAVPLEDNQSRVSEFLLVPYLGACIHTPPPPPNQIVHVRTSTAFDVTAFDPIWVTGELRISKTRSPYGDVAFQLTALSISAYQEHP